MRQMRCKLIGGARVTAPDYGMNLIVGQVVDLDERLPCGGVLADVVHPDWFEALSPDIAEAPRRRRSPMSVETTDMPASPATEE